MKRIISAVLAFLMIFSVFSVSVMNVSAADNDIIFECGANITATFEPDTGVLTISGKGELNFFYNDKQPWFSYREKITEIIVEEGITYIDAGAFINCYCKKITLPASLEAIGNDAFFSAIYLEEIVIPENSKLYRLRVSSSLDSTPWYKNQPDGPVYLGKMFLTYKGKMPENTTFEIKDGTFAINTFAFYGQTNLVDIKVPDSVERIGYNAFYNTTWYDNQPDYECIYLGKVLYYYEFPWRAIQASDIKEKLVIPEGIVSISDLAFSGHCTFKNVVLPLSLEHIGEEAFSDAFYLESITVPENSSLKSIGRIAFASSYKLKEIALPEGLESIGTNAFADCRSLKSVALPASLKLIALVAFTPNSLDSFTVAPESPYFTTDENGILYSKDMTAVYASPQRIEAEEIAIPDTVKEIKDQALVDLDVKKISLPKSVNRIGFEAFGDCENLESINIPYGVERINERTFSKCGALREIEIPKSVRYIGSYAFYACYLNKIIIPEETVYVSESAFDSSYPTVYCYPDSTAYHFAQENKMSFVLLEKPDLTQLEKLLEEYKNLDRNKYFPESLVALDEAVAKVDFTITVITQEMADGWADEIENAKAGLRYIPADYSAVDAAKTLAANVNRSLYTEESLAALDAAIAAVNTEIDISDQATVDAYAKAIEDAVKNLRYLPADYTQVNTAVAKSKKINRKYWSQSSLTALDQSIKAVDYTLNITQQAVVDGFAKRINEAIAALEYAEIILKNKQHGVIVSATTKEINPDTSLSVDLKDASDLQSGNFAVGGTVKSVTLYDINLLLNAKKVQPDGSVTVKIKLPDGVDPKRCKVYHVVDDPIDNLVRFATTLEGNYIVFETDHFSEFAVIEVETTLESIEITKLPEKTEFALGEAVLISGMEVTATFSDGSKQVITDYDVSSVDNSSVGTKTVTVYFTYNGLTKSHSFDITITGGKVGISITESGNDAEEYTKKVAWYKPYCLESVQLGYATTTAGNYKVVWSSDNDKVIVDSNGNVTNKGFFFARKAVITAKIVDSQGSVIASDSITVRFYKFNLQLSRLLEQTLSYFRYR